MSPRLFVTGTQLSSAIKRIICAGRADLAVAFWGDKACDLIGLPTQAKGYRIACDAYSGACRPEAILELIERGAAVFDVPGVHAKVYLGKGEMVVCSANASSNGLGGDGNELDLEAGLICDDPREVAAAGEWMERLFREGARVTAADGPELRDCWNKRPHDKVQRLKGKFLERLKSEPDWFKDRRLWVVWNDSATPSQNVLSAYEASAFNRRQEDIEEISWPFYWDTDAWDVAPGDLLLDFLREGARVRCTGIWRVLGQINGSITPVEYVERPLNLAFPATDMAKLGPETKRRGVLDSMAPKQLLDVVSFARALRGD